VAEATAQFQTGGFQPLDLFVRRSEPEGEWDADTCPDGLAEGFALTSHTDQVFCLLYVFRYNGCRRAKDAGCL